MICHPAAAAAGPSCLLRARQTEGRGRLETASEKQCLCARGPIPRQSSLGQTKATRRPEKDSIADIDERCVSSRFRFLFPGVFGRSVARTAERPASFDERKLFLRSISLPNQKMPQSIFVSSLEEESNTPTQVAHTHCHLVHCGSFSEAAASFCEASKKSRTRSKNNFPCSSARRALESSSR